MNPTTFLFYLFAFVLLFAAFRVITAKSTVHAALFLVLAFFNAACIWMMLKAEFLSIALVLVYVGAVMVLFLFVVMMLDVNTDAWRTGFWKRLPTVGLVGLLIFLEMAIILRSGFNLTVPSPHNDVATVGMDNTRQLGIDLFTNYLYPLQIAAVLLLVAIIAAISLTLRERKESKAIDASMQIRVKKADRLRVIRMDAVVEPEAGAPPAVPPKGAA